MNNLRKLVQLLLSLLTLALFAWAGWQGYLLLSRQQDILEPGTRATLVIIAILSLVCVYMLNTALRKSSVNIAQLPIKVQLYQEFLLQWQSEPTEQSTLNIRMALLAALPVIKAVNQLIAVSVTGGTSSAKTKEALIIVLRAMRSDLGDTGFFQQKELVKLLK